MQDFTYGLTHHDLQGPGLREAYVAVEKEGDC